MHIIYSIKNLVTRVRIFYLCLIFNVLVFHLSVYAQKNQEDSLFHKRRLITEIRFDVGNVFPTNDFVRMQNSDLDGMAHYSAYSLRLARQTTGDNFWQQLYGYPYYGVGIYSATYTNIKKLGHPIAVYGFFNAPFFKVSRLSLNYELGFGLTTNFNSSDSLGSAANIAISADKSVYIDAAVILKYKINNRFAVNLGYGFTHFSNGRLAMPNKGLNTGSTKISFSYALNDDPIHYQLQPKLPISNQFEWIHSGYGGMRNMLYSAKGPDNVTKFKSVNFAVYGISNIINRQINYKSKLGVGFTMEYNGSQNSNVVLNDGNIDELVLPFDRHISLSIYPSYELVINKLSLVLQPGFYLLRKKSSDMTPMFYQRIGIKYYIMKDTFLGINLRAVKFYESDFIEWSIGHRLWW